ncbi:kinetochore scaffold 1 isoform X2 [Perognathus longimembris pacificus]|uniref:kinetochore scaffold 1 isoform X2 n=1 Tax=Perognathus longimembris pacificus TaxID=214514 RepID=UPI002019A4A4|nr:kinetochore scaffold 1 isoform X2 [Perognathus longimembris pacificus]
MDGVSSAANEEKDKMEKPVRRRHSSILKPPRSPLQDLRSGNEIVQESNTLRNRKSSRRVSFADTIKVFQTESHMKTVRKSEIAEAGENVLPIQNRNSDDKYCEITGMNTLLCAPIQTQMQQREFSVIDPSHENKNAKDQTVIFSDENQMDLTASHTVMITEGLLDCTKSKNSTKIDTASFLTKLKCHKDNVRMKKELKIPMDQHSTQEKKINSSDLIQRLKTRKNNACPASPDKENFEIPVYSKQSNSASSIHQMHASLNVNDNSINITRIFREQDDGMDFTQCHTANIHTLFPPSSEANLVGFKQDITTYENDCMDLTSNYTLQVLPSASNLSKMETQTHNITKDVEAVGGTETAEKSAVRKTKQNSTFQDSSLNPQHKTHCSPIIESETPAVTGTSNQHAKTMAMNSESVCCSPAVVEGYKTFFYSSCNDAMELTKCLSSMREEKSLLEPAGNYSQGHDANSVLAEKTFYSGEDGMDITKSHTVVIDNQIFKQDKTDVPVTSAPIAEEAVILQNHTNVAEDVERNVNCQPLPQVSKARLQHSLTNSLSLHLTDKKTPLLEEVDRDLTESHTTNLSQAPLASYIPAPESITKSYSCNKSPPDKWGKMLKNIQPSEQPNLIPENNLNGIQVKEKRQILKVSPYLPSDSLLTADYLNCNVAYSGTGLDKQVALRNNGNTVSREQPSFSPRKSFLSSDCPSGHSAMKNCNTGVSSHIAKSVPGQSSKVPELLRRDLDDPTHVSYHDKAVIGSEEEQTMDLTRSHTVVIKFAPSEVQDLSRSTLEQSNGQVTTVNRPIAAKGKSRGKSPIEKTGVFLPNDTFGVLEDKSVQKPEFLMAKQNIKVCGRTNVNVSKLKIDKTIVFSEGVENDMEITKGCTVDISHRSLLDKCDSNLMPVAGTSKTILYACGQDEMEITTSHTVALECERVSSNEKMIRPVEKTTIFVENHDELEMTKSHTVFIDYHAEEKTLPPDRPKFGLPKRKSLGIAGVTSLAEKNVFCLENGDSNHPAAKKGRQLADPEEYSRHHPGGECGTLMPEDDLEVSKLTSWKNVKDVQKPGFPNEFQSGKTQRRKSLRLKNDHTIAFSEDDKNDTVITQSSRAEINNRGTLDGREDSNWMPLPGTSKTIWYACGQDEMEITTSHTAALECERVSSNERIIRPMEKTTMFADNQDDLEVTKSHTVFIDCQATEKTLPEYPAFGIASEENSTEDNSCVQEITKKQELAEQKPQMKTFIPPQSEMEFAKFPRADSDEVVMGKIADQAYGVKGAQVESCHIDSTDRIHVDFTSGPGAVVCGPSDNWKQGLKNLHGKTEGFVDLQTVQVPSTPEQVLELGNTGYNNKSMVQSKEIDNIISNDAEDNRNEEKKSLNGPESMSVPLKTAGRDKMRRCSLGIFLPRLPNKRNCSVTGIDDPEQIPAESTDLNRLEILPVSTKDLGTASVASKMNLSPSQYINEENLPIYPGEINSSDSISIEIEENTLIETDQKATLPSDNRMEETDISHKRTWVQEGDAVANEKKIRKHDIMLGDTTQDQEAFDSHTEEDIDKHVNSVLAKSPSRTPSSCSSSLDSVKADGTSLDFSTNRNSQMESQFLSDTICEESLREKLKDGSITIRDFFILLQVHIVIQKPRKSNLPARFTTNISPTPEDLMLRQYVYGPKIEIYREDCELLRQKIEALKISALNQDKLLTDVNRNLWEKMRHYSDEELKAFGTYLNKIKSRSTKMTKVFTHQGKVALYNKLVQSAQNEREKLEIKMNEMDTILKKISHCLTEVEVETKNLENEEKDNSVDEWNSQMRAAENELKQLKTEEKELERALLEVEVQKKQTLAQIDFMQKQINRTEEQLNQLSLSEWEITEWSDAQAVFTFVYDTIKLTFTFGEALAGIPFLDKANRKIAEVDFQSLLDEEKAPPSSLLVHKLIFQYIEEQEPWKKKCTTQHQVPQMLHELSLVVKHCRLLGEEIEFLKRWGPNYNLMHIDMKHSELKLLFSSSAAFAKFELTLSVSAYYPSVPLPFTIQNHLGNIGHDEIATIMSKVPLEDNFLKNVVKQIHQDLLQDCHSSTSPTGHCCNN